MKEKFEMETEILRGLNSDQKSAVLFDHQKNGPLLILAAAGSGKTSVLTRRIQWRVLQGVCPESILALTFTAKAAQEMRERVQKLFPDADIRLSTFHSLAFSILRERFGEKFGWELAGFEKAPKPGEGEAERFACALVDHRMRPDAISRDELFNPGISHKLMLKLEPIRRDVLRTGKIVFEDLIYLSTGLIEKNRDVQTAVRNRFREILVDEYQDINPSQYLLVRAILGENRSLFAVGDDDQAIYGFRGADIGNVFRFCKDFPTATLLRLEWNYRSVPKVLYLANNIFRDKPLLLGKTLRAGNSSRHPLFLENRDPELWVSGDPQTEMLRIVSKIKELRMAYDLEFKNFAILVRYNRQRLYYEEALESFRIPVYREGDAEAPEISGVHVETVHGSKGLQYTVVFYAGLAENLTPGEAGGTRRERRAQLDEEKRLFYVGVTRAEAVLILLYCKRRFWKGRLSEFKPSRFLSYLNRPIPEKSPMPLFFFRIRAVVLILGYMMLAVPPFLFRSVFCRKSLAAWIERRIQEFSRFCFKALRVQIDIENQSALSRVDWSRPVIVVGNHQSYFDIPIVFITLGRSIGFFAKKELTYIPFLNFWMKEIHCIFVDRKNSRAGVEIKNRLEASNETAHVFIFPEGTRSKDGSVGAFKSGAFRLAADLNAIILPVYIQGSRETWESRKNSDRVVVHSAVLEPIDVGELSKEKPVNPKTELAPLVYEKFQEKALSK